MTIRVFQRIGVPAALCLTVLAAGFQLQACGGGDGGAGARLEKRGDRDLARRLDEYMSRLVAFDVSGALVVAKDGEVVLARGYGLADRENEVPFSPQTVVTVGSITKQFTAAAILKLQEMGRLSVEDRIDRFFPDAPEDKRRITLHHLLTHTAGFEAALGDDFDETATRDRVVEQALASDLLHEPGGPYVYSNVGYSLLGAIVEIASGQPYEVFLKQHLFDPAGMTRTGYRLADWSGLAVARGYDGKEPWGTVLERPWMEDGPYWHLRANGGIHSTLEDMYRWHLALLDDRVLSAASREAMFTPFADEGGGESHYGYGWSIARTPRGTTRIAHNGGNGIFFADVLRFVDEGAVVLFATNTARSGSERVSTIIPAILFGEDYPVPPKVARIDPAGARRLAGSYALPSGDVVEIAAGEDGRLRASARGEAFCLISSGEAHRRPDLDRLAARTAGILGQAIRGTIDPIETALDSRMPRAELEQIFKERRATWTGEHGEYRSTSPVAAVPETDDEVVVLARSDFARGAIHHRVVWAGGRIAGARLTFDPAIVFYPESENEFSSFDLDRPTIVRISFEPAADGDGVRLVVHGPSGATRLARSDRAGPG